MASSCPLPIPNHIIITTLRFELLATTQCLLSELLPRWCAFLSWLPGLRYIPSMTTDKG